MAFNDYSKGPPCRTLSELSGAIYDLSQQQQTIIEDSRPILQKLIASNHIPVYHTTCTPGRLLRIRIAIQHLMRLRRNTYPPAPLAAVVILQAWDSTNSLDVTTSTFRNIFKTPGTVLPNGEAIAWGSVLLVKGLPTSGNGSNLEESAKRVQRALEETMRCSKLRKFLWHEAGASLLLDRVLDLYSNEGVARSRFKGVILTELLRTNNEGAWRFHKQDAGSLTTAQSIIVKAQYHGIPVVLQDPSNLGLSDLRASEMPGFQYIWPALLPADAFTQTQSTTFDNVTSTIFRLAASCTERSGEGVVEVIKERFSEHQATARVWAKSCLDPSTYTSCSIHPENAKKGLKGLASTLDTPTKIDAEHLTSTLLDPDRPIENLFLAPVATIVHSNAEFRLDPCSTLYVLLSTAEDAPWNHLLANWTHFVDSISDSFRDIRISVGLAKTWMALREVLLEQMVYVRDLEVSHSWSSEQRKRLDMAIEVLDKGSMTGICERSLDMEKEKKLKVRFS